MRKVLAAVAVVMMVVAVGLAAPGEAQAQYRQFTGKHRQDQQEEADRRQPQGRQGLVREGRTRPRSPARTRRLGQDLKKGDWVTVDWKMIDKPRKAYKVNVLPAAQGRRRGRIGPARLAGGGREHESRGPLALPWHPGGLRRFQVVLELRPRFAAPA